MKSVTIYSGDGTSATISLPDNLAAMMVASGRAIPVNPADFAAITSTAGAFLTGTSVFSIAAAAGSPVSAVADPYVGLGLGSSTFVDAGGDPQLALVGNEIVVGTTAAIAGTRYKKKVRAVSADGSREIADTLYFTAMAPVSIGPAAPVFTKLPSITPGNGTVGQQFTADDGAVAGATSIAARWLLAGVAIGTSGSVTPVISGALVREVTATGPGGVTVATSTPVTVSAVGITLSSHAVPDPATPAPTSSFTVDTGSVASFIGFNYVSGQQHFNIKGAYIDDSNYYDMQVSGGGDAVEAVTVRVNGAPVDGGPGFAIPGGMKTGDYLEVRRTDDGKQLAFYVNNVRAGGYRAVPAALQSATAVKISGEGPNIGGIKAGQVGVPLYVEAISFTNGSDGSAAYRPSLNITYTNTNGATPSGYDIEIVAGGEVVVARAAARIVANPTAGKATIVGPTPPPAGARAQVLTVNVYQQNNAAVHATTSIYFPGKVSFGTNLNGAGDDRLMPQFANLALNSGFQADSGTIPDGTFDANGNVINIPSGGIGLRFPPPAVAGRVAITWTGQPGWQPGLDQQGVTFANQVRVSSNRIEVDITGDHGSSGTSFCVLHFGAAGPCSVTNLDIRPLTTPADAIWDPAFVTRTQRVAGPIRFSTGHQQINENAYQTFTATNRKKPGNFSQSHSADGTCWEYMVKLCQLAGRPGWWSIPFGAADDYITAFAQYLDANMPAGPIYIESVGNEHWNSAAGFTNFYALQAEAKASGRPGTSPSMDTVTALYNGFVHRLGHVRDVIRAAVSTPGRMILVAGFAPQPNQLGGYVAQGLTADMANMATEGAYYSSTTGTTDPAAYDAALAASQQSRINDLLISRDQYKAFGWGFGIYEGGLEVAGAGIGYAGLGAYLKTQQAADRAKVLCDAWRLNFEGPFHWFTDASQFAGYGLEQGGVPSTPQNVMYKAMSDLVASS